jgi:segregation and condensation protein A
MEEKVPWWRWALAFALGGIRSGFGLLRRNGGVETSAASGAAGASGEPESSLETENSPEPENERLELSAETSAGPEDGDVEPSNEIGALKGHDFSRAVNGSESDRPLGPEGCSSQVDPEIESISAASETPFEVASERDAGAEADLTVEVAGHDEEEETEIALTKTSLQSEEVEAEVKQAASVPSSEEEPAAKLAVPAAEARPAEASAPAQATEVAPAARPIAESPPAPPFAPPPAPLPAISPDPAQTAPEQEAETAPESTTTAQAAPPQEAAPTQETTPTLPPAVKPALEPTTAEKVAAALKARGEDAEQSPFSVIVDQVYDGPLDLLLDLIRRQDIDIYDIPIAKITAQFLAYVDRLRASDMDVAGEFIYTAALLIHIKSKMLLPRAPVGPEEPAEDPRRELVERLLEHERFKNAAQMLHEKQMLEAATWTNPGAREFREDESAEPEIAADTTDLVRIFRDILERARNRPILDVEEDAVTVSQMIQFLARRLTMEDKPVALRRLLSHTRSERALIAMFLALLELVRLQAILLRQDRHFSEIFIKKHAGFEAAMNQGLANARDDWR